MDNRTETGQQGVNPNRSQEILDRYLQDKVAVAELVKKPNPAVFQEKVAEAASEIEILSLSQSGQLVEGIFNLLAKEVSLSTDQRDTALELLKLVDLRKLDKQQIASTYLKAVRDLGDEAEVLGSITALLEAGKIIAPFLLSGQGTGEALESAWDKVARRYEKQPNASNPNSDYMYIINGKAEIMLALPEEIPLLPRLPAVPPPSPSQPPPSIHFPNLSGFWERIKKSPKKESSERKGQRSIQDQTEAQEKAGVIFRQNFVVEREAVPYEIEANSLEMPWANEDVEIKLDHYTLKQTGGKSFYLGTFIAKGPLTEAASLKFLKEGQRDHIYRSLYSGLPTFIQTHTLPTNFSILDPGKKKSNWDSYYVRNPAGQRLYFIEMPGGEKRKTLGLSQETLNQIKDESVIIIVAVCDKNKQEPVLSELTYSSQKDIVYRARLH